jgi:hypothetical protein
VKNRYATVLALVVLMAAVAPAQIMTLSQSANSVTVNAGATVACGGTGFTVDNSWLRAYPLAAVGGNIDLVSVTFGVEQITHNNFPITIRIYNDTTPPVIAPYAGLTLLHTENVLLSTAALSVVTIPLTGPRITMTPLDNLVVEVFAPMGQGQFRLGSNALGQTAPNYLRALGCGLAEPTDPTLIAPGFPNMHAILNVDYVFNGITPTYPGTNEDLTLYTAINTNPLTTGIGQDIKTANAGDTISIKFVSNGGTFNNKEMFLVGQPILTGFPPSPILPNIWENVGLVLLVGGTIWPVGPALMPPGGFTINLVVPPGLTGLSALLQGAVLAPPLPLNGFYASTDTHEIMLN